MNESKLEKYSQIEPIYFCLSSFGRSIERKDVGDDWEDVLDYNDLSAEDFDKYEKWWFSPAGNSLIEILKSKFIVSILETVPSGEQVQINKILEEANWSDFICEISGIFGGESYDFLEYAVEDGLLSKLDDSDLNEHGIEMDKLLRLLQNWFDTKSDDALEILLEGYSVLIQLNTN